MPVVGETVAALPWQRAYRGGCFDEMALTAAIIQPCRSCFYRFLRKFQSDTYMLVHTVSAGFTLELV